MAQVVYRANLSAANFPFLSEYQGRTVIVPQADNTYVPQIASKEDDDKDRGIPQIYYCHNVMPTQHGFQSIGYRNLVNPLAGNHELEDIHLIRDSVNRQVFLARDRVTGNLYYLRQNTTDWQYLATYGTAGTITSAFVSGTTYIFLQNVGCFYLDLSTYTLVPVTLAGLTISSIIGITGSFGYLLAWSSDAVAWSSTIDPTDFVPSLTTGAGGGLVEGARGAINLVVKHTLGFIVYTTDNAVAAIFSGNSRYPFNFREIVSSGGVASLDLISWDANTGNHWVYSTSGLQMISMQQSHTMFPAVTDFISGKLFEDFNEATLEFSQTVLTSTLRKKVTVVSDRYLIISYGIRELTHAIVYDLVQKRWGKLKLTHTSVFEFTLLSPRVTETPKDSIAFLQKDGSIYVVDFSIHSQINSGIMILGKFQYIRQRLLQLEEANVENMVQSGEFALYDLASLDGKNTSTKIGYLQDSTGLYRKYKFHTTGINHSLLFKGSFYLVSVVLSFNIHGRR